MEPQSIADGFTGCVRKEVLTLMKQIGNLAIVCARRKDVTLCIEQGRVMVLPEGACALAALSADWDDDETILSIIHELNFGRCASKSQ